MSQDSFPKGYNEILKILHDEFPAVSQKDIEMMVNSFWGDSIGVKKYLRGINTFTVKGLFSFNVSNLKAPAILLRKKLQRRKDMLKYMRKYRRDVQGCTPRVPKKKLNEDQTEYYFIGKFLKKQGYAIKITKKGFKTFDEALIKLIRLYNYTNYNYEDIDFNISSDHVKEKKVFKDGRFYFAIYKAKIDDDLITYPYGHVNNETNQIY